jgi:hypothetical protein
MYSSKLYRASGALSLFVLRDPNAYVLRYIVAHLRCWVVRRLQRRRSR